MLPVAVPVPVPLGRLASSELKLQQSHPPGPSPLPSENPTKSFWLHSAPDANPLANEGSQGTLTTDTDVCIIGSGITGVSAAYHLSRAVANSSSLQIKVVILEARQFCSGATGRNGGHLVANPFLHFVAATEAHGMDEAKKGLSLEQYNRDLLLELIAKNHWEKDIDLQEGGMTTLLLTAEEENRLRADFESANAQGVPLDNIEWLDANATNERYGVLQPSVRSPAHSLWPLKLVTKLFYLAKSSSSSWLPWPFRARPRFTLALHTHTPALSISAVGDKWSISTPRGNINTRYIIHATNAYASHLLPHLQGPTGIIPTRGQVIATRSSVPLPISSLSANEGFEYWFPRPAAPNDKDCLVIIGGGREIAEEYELYVSDDSEVNDEVGKGLRKFLPALFGKEKFEAGREPEMEWTGIMGFTATGDPFVGPLDDRGLKGQFIIAGYSGHGMPRATACAEVVSQMIVHDIQGVKDPWIAPTWLPKHYLTTNC